MKPAPVDPFDQAMQWLAPIEGGNWHAGPTDPNDTRFGITQTTFDHWRDKEKIPRASVFTLTRDEARAIYDAEYWIPAGCDAIAWPEALTQFDTAVNCGVGTARHIHAQAGASLAQYDALRRAYYRGVAKRQPAKAPNLPGWLKRLDKLTAYMEPYT